MRTTDASRPEKSKSPLFGPPLLFDGEDPQTYDQIHTKVSDTLRPADIIAEILVRDFIDLAF
jgi:hypothetical protein